MMKENKRSEEIGKKKGQGKQKKIKMQKRMAR